MNFAIVVAAGQGRRFGKEKQFVLVKNKPVIFYSLNILNKSSSIDNIIVVTKKNRINFTKTLIQKYKFHKVSAIVVGGKKRQDSVNNALRIIPDKGYVAVHDAARPLFDENLIRYGFAQVGKSKACIPALPVQSTIKEIKSGKVHRTIDRSDLYYIQTPQFFDIKILKMAYAQAYRNNYYATDDAGLIEKFGYKVYMLPGSKKNIKVTDKDDLAIVKSLL